MISNKKLHQIVAELRIRGRKRIIPFLHNLNSLYQNNIRLNYSHFFIMKVTNKRELQQISINNSSDIHRKYFMNLYKKVFCKTLFYSSCIR